MDLVHKPIQDRRILARLGIVVGIIAMGGLIAVSAKMFHRMSTPSEQPDTSVPFYQSAAPKTLPSVLPARLFSRPDVQEAYKAASRSPAVFAQMPCYCRCDRALGHKGLLACFNTEHGARCSTCVAEALFVKRELAQGKTVDEIRRAIIAVQGQTDSVQTK
jgi:Protein of unknown function with PCYCGC motif